MNVKQLYTNAISNIYNTGAGAEHSYRPALCNLIEKLCPGRTIINDGRRIQCGQPDLAIKTKSNVTVFYVETKNIGDNDLLGNQHNKIQFDKYKQALKTIIFTNYLEFRLFKNNELLKSVTIGEVLNGNIIWYSDKFQELEEMINLANSSELEPITDIDVLSKLMATKAKLLAQAIKDLDLSTSHRDENDELYENPLFEKFLTIKRLLLKDLVLDDFASTYAQTITYGLLAARLNDDTPETFSKEEAYNLLPDSNAFLKQFFHDIAFEVDSDYCSGLSWIVEELVDIFSAIDLKKIVQQYETDPSHPDFLMHFYENFLTDFDKDAKKQHGVWYTPEPIVKFIVSAIDEILISKFNMPRGLGDSSKDLKILDPATGTGTFLAEVVNKTYEKFQNNQGIWPAFVEQTLLPRLNGFELMMTSYTIAHLKLAWLLKKTGYDLSQQKKAVNIYLTNSLEEPDNQRAISMAPWLSKEANLANRVKKNPVFVMLGNPPYQCSSDNKSKWITKLCEVYKNDINEKNKKPLSDDCIKFIRLGEYKIEQNDSGILAYICSNTFLDGMIHYKMREHLLKTFDEIYIVNLHGNTRKGETDENVFDIMLGVSINIFVKTGKKAKNELGKVYYQDLFGTREEKFNWLNNHNRNNVDWTELNVQAPNYFFVPKDLNRNSYSQGFKITELLLQHSAGISSGSDTTKIYTDNHSNTIAFTHRPWDQRYLDNSGLRRACPFLQLNMQLPNIAIISDRKNPESICTTKLSELHASGLVFPLYIYTQTLNQTTKQPNLDPTIWKKINEIINYQTTPENIMYYVYGWLWDLKYLKENEEAIREDFTRIPYPESKEQFDKYVAYGRQLMQLHLMNNIASWNCNCGFPIMGSDIVSKKVIWKENKIYINDKQYFDNVSEAAWNFTINNYPVIPKWFKARKEKKLTMDDFLWIPAMVYSIEETIKLTNEFNS